MNTSTAWSNSADGNVVQPRQGLRRGPVRQRLAFVDGGLFDAGQRGFPPTPAASARPPVAATAFNESPPTGTICGSGATCNTRQTATARAGGGNCAPRCVDLATNSAKLRRLRPVVRRRHGVLRVELPAPGDDADLGAAGPACRGPCKTATSTSSEEAGRSACTALRPPVGRPSPTVEIYDPATKQLAERSPVADRPSAARAPRLEKTAAIYVHRRVHRQRGFRTRWRSTIRPPGRGRAELR